MTKKQPRNFNRRYASEYNVFRSIFYLCFLYSVVIPFFTIFYNYKITGTENLPKWNKKDKYIFTANHVSIFDPFLVPMAVKKLIAFMAKKELFDIPFLRWWIDWLGAFAVNRESLGPSTVKTVKIIKDSKWVLGLFPQGTRGIPGEIRGINKGFEGLAKITKCAILPVGIIGTNEVKRWPFTGKIIVNIGKPIPYSNNPDETMKKWIDSIQELTGFKYIPDENPDDTIGVKND